MGAHAGHVAGLPKSCDLHWTVHFHFHLNIPICAAVEDDFYKDLDGGQVRASSKSPNLLRKSYPEEKGYFVQVA